jgi:hypothetical protein
MLLLFPPSAARRPPRELQGHSLPRADPHASGHHAQCTVNFAEVVGEIIEGRRSRRQPTNRLHFLKCFPRIIRCIAKIESQIKCRGKFLGMTTEFDLGCGREWRENYAMSEATCNACGKPPSELGGGLSICSGCKKMVCVGCLKKPCPEHK